MSSHSTSGVSKKKYESSSQSRLTSFFKPSPEAHVSKKGQERNDSLAKKIGVKKRIIQESPTKVVNHTSVSPVKSHEAQVVTNNSVPNVKIRKRIIQNSSSREESPVKKKNEVIAIDLDSSDKDSILEEELFPSPQKKFKIAKVAKRPIEIHSSLISKPSMLPDYSTKKAGLAMRSPNKSSLVRDYIPARVALEEKKSLNREKRSAVPEDDIFSPVKKLKRTHSVTSSQGDNVKGNEERRSCKTTDQQEPVVKPSFVTLFDCTSNSFSNQSQSKDENKSKTSEILSENLNFTGKIDAAKKVKPTTTRNFPETSTKNNVSSSRHRVSESKSSAISPDVSKKQKEIVKVKVTSKSVETKPKKEESTGNVQNVDKVTKDAKSEGVKNKEAEILHKAPRIVRRSALNTTEKNGLSISPKIIVGLEEIEAGAVVAFRETYKDIETLLDLNLDVTICPDIKKTLQITKRVLPNNSHANFKFYMNRKPVEHIEALRSQRVDCYQYPHALDLHTVIHEILRNGSEHNVLHRAQELIFGTLSFHPSVNAVMKKYYWSVLPQHFDDTDPCSRWEIVRELLEEVLNADGDDAKKMYIDPKKPPTKLERTRAVLGVIIHILREDLRCWISLTTQPSAQLHDRNDLPLVARLIWPQTMIPHINGTCRELINFHVSALKSSNPTNLLYTEPLVKMMTIVTQMTDLHLPLKIRKPGEHMMNLAREIVLHLDNLTGIIDSSFCSSFGSSELELLLPLVILNRLKPQIIIPEGENLNLTWMLKSYLKIDVEKSREEVVAHFWTENSALERNTFLTALSAYLKLFCSFKTWFHMRTKYRDSCSRFSPTPSTQQTSSLPPSVSMFSNTFTLKNLLEDLRQAKYLLEDDKESAKKDRPLYSALSWK